MRRQRTEPTEEFSTYPIYLVIVAMTGLGTYLMLATDFLANRPTAKVYLFELDAENHECHPQRRLKEDLSCTSRVR